MQTLTVNALAGAVPIVASTLCRKYGVEVTFGGDTAHTNGEVINLPAMLDNPVGEGALFGYLTHECGHVRFTTFKDVVEGHMDDLVHMFSNILEDGRIEKLMQESYAGAAYFLRETYRFILRQTSDPEDFVFGKDDVDGEQALTVLANYVFLWAHIRMSGFGDLYDARWPNAVSVMTNRFGPVFKSRLDEILTKAEGATSTLEVILRAREIVELLKEFSDPDVQQEQQAQKPQPGPQSDQGGSPSGGGKGGNSSSGEGGASSQASSSQNSTSGHQSSDNPQGSGESDDGESREGEDAASGATSGAFDNHEDGKSDNPAQGSQSSTDSSRDDSSADAQAPKMSRLQARRFAKAARDAANAVARKVQRMTEKLDQNRTIARKLEAGAENLSLDRVAPAFFGNSGLSTSCSGEDSKILPRDKNEALPAVDQIVPQLRRRLHSLLEAKARTARRQTPNGGRLTLKGLERLISGRPDVFTRKSVQDDTNTAVHILIDMSGSMADEGKIDGAKTAAAALMQAFAGIRNVSVGVSAFSDWTPQSKRVKTVRPLLKQGRNLSSIAVRNAETRLIREIPRGATPLKEGCIAGALALATDGKATRRVLIVVTDDEIPDMTKLHERLRNSGIETRCLCLDAACSEEYFDVVKAIPRFSTPERISSTLIKMVSEAVS